ncbi:AAA family ATPase [Paucibacter sp. B51]|uniref:AAA family ATPase n=1 Tax=Paucibacter sp. B51 TaxID=2993315 RepID=UPI0022EBD929|nr:AAA family ATPase [Paucibacter sp. B51]
MTIQAVQAVFFAKYTASNFRAVYGRLPTDANATYTKDFFQVLQAAGDALAGVLPASRTQDTDIEYVWPTGRCPGKFLWRDPRWQMKWPTGQKPLPWTIGNTNTAEVSIPGNPGLQEPAAADAEHAAINASGVEPWLVAVKLAGEDHKLHVRTYFRNPAPQFADRALAQLPTVVLDAINALPNGDGSGTIVLPAIAALGPRPTPRVPALVSRIQEALQREPNVLLVGPPGTGKTVALEDLQALYDYPAPVGTVLFDTTAWGNSWSVWNAPQSRSEVLVFHPSYSYENFVAGLYPTSSQHGISLEAKPGPLLCLSHWVGKGNRQALLVIDEFNRGSAAAIFGDCLSLLDKDKRSSSSHAGARITRPYPGQKMPVPEPYWDVPGTAENFASEVRLPAGVHILAAMNSTDRSVAPVDAAMRRRFTVIRVGPDYEALAQHLGLAANSVDQGLPPVAPVTGWQLDDVSRLAVRVLRAVNARIEFCLGEDFELGHALLWHLTATAVAERLTQLCMLVDTKVVPTLRMTFVDQDEALAAVLCVSDASRASLGQPAPTGLIAYWKEAPQGLASIADKRLSVRSLTAMDSQEQLAALNALL